MILSVHPPEFLPYLGFWNRLYHSDLMIIADTMRFRNRHYQNRNRIRTFDGWTWVTLPVSHNSDYAGDIELKSKPDTERSMSVLEANYRGRAHYWDSFYPEIRKSLQFDKLIDVNLSLIAYIKNVLDVKTPIKVSSSITDVVTDDFLALSIHLAEIMKADTLLASAGNIGNFPKRYPNSKVKFIFQDYVSIPYPQIYAGWQPRMSVIDCLMTHGAEYTKKHVVSGWLPQEETDA